MNISIFKAIGPIMIGPSSSHTAGATKLARISRKIVGKSYNHVSFGLHGSFAKTYKGHGTDYALVGGALGLKEDDLNIPHSFKMAEEKKLTFDFYEIELEGAHENSVKITFSMNDGTEKNICGSSLGGGQVLITKIDDFETEFSVNSTTILIMQNDEAGVTNKVTGVLARNNINIGIMKLSRVSKGGVAFCVIETDHPVDDSVKNELQEIKQIINLKVINIEEDF